MTAPADAPREPERWPRQLLWLAIGLGVLLPPAAMIGGRLESPWLLASLFVQSAVILLLGTLLSRRLVVQRRAELSLQSASRDLQGTRDSLDTAYNALRATEGALRQSEQKFRDAANSAAMMFWTGDSAGHTTFANKALCEFRGLTEEEARQRPWDDGIHPDDLPACRTIFAQALARREPWRFEYRYRRHDGADRWLLEMGTPQYDDEGSFAGVVGTCVDITEQRETEAALRTAQEELKRARQQLVEGIEGLTDGWALYDADDRLVICNHRYRDLFGLHADLLRPGTPFTDILRAHVDAGRVAAAIGREDAWIAERVAQHRDPHGLFERCIDGHWFRFSDRPTSEGGTVTIFTPIDELKQREQRLRESQEILRQVLDHIPIAVNVKDREGRYVLMNPFLANVFGVVPEQVIGRLPEEVQPPYAGRERHRESHDRVVQTGEPIVAQEDIFSGLAGDETWLTTKTPVKDAAGRVTSVITLSVPVPQLAKANRELADNRAFLLDAERQAKIASWLQYADAGYRTEWSENLEAILGYTSAEIYDDETFLAVVHRDDRERLQSLFGEIDEHPRSYDAEYRVVAGDGRVIWVRGITKVEFDDAGNLVRYIGTIQDITGAKQAEQALRDSAALLKEAQLRARLAHWLWDPAVNRYVVAAEAEAILGLPVAGLSTNNDFLPYVHEEDRAWVAETYRAWAERLEPSVIEYRWRRPDGKVIWLRDLCEQELDTTGRVRRLVGTIQDVTGQKRSEEELRENQALLLAAQRRARIAYWLEDTGSGGRAYTTSDFMAEVLGLSPEAVPTNDSDHVKIVHPEDRARVAHAYERAVVNHEPYAIEYRVMRADGGIGWMRELAEFQLGATGKPVRLLGTIQDITGQKAIETAQRDSEARMRAFMDHAPAVMYLKDAQGRYQIVNRAFEELEEFTADEVQGKTIFDLRPHDSTAILAAQDSEVLEQGRVVTREISDPTRWIYQHMLVTKFPVRDAAGGIVGIGCFAQDITQQKRAEQALRDSEARLLEAQRRARLAHWEWVKDTDLYHWSTEAAMVLGISGRPLPMNDGEFLQIIHPDDRGWMSEHYGETNARPNAYNIEYRVMRTDGSSTWIRELAEVIADESGQAVRAVGTVQDITEQRLTEQALRDSEARMRAILDHAPMIIHLKDREGRFQLINREFERAEGVAAEWLRGRTIFDVLPRDAAEAIKATDDDVLKYGRMVVHEYHVAGRADYQDRMTVKFPVRDGMGAIVGLGAFTQDVTERKRAENALRDSEVRLRRAQQLARLAYWVWDRDADFYVWAPGSGIALGLPDAELPATDAGYRAIVHPADREALWRLYDTVWADGDTYTTEFRILRPDGEVVWVEEIGEVRRDAAARRLTASGTVQDISERKRSEAALRDSEARLRGFLDHAPFAMYLKDTALRYQVVNRAVEQFRGMTAAEICGKTPMEIYPPVLAERFIAEDREVLARGVPVTFEYSDQTLGSYADSLSVRFPVRDSSGQIIAIGGITQDTSERKRAERALRESEARLKDAQRRAKLAYWSWDPVAREYAFGEEYRDIIGVASPQEVQTDDQYLHFVHEADRHSVAMSLQRQRDDLEPGVLEYRVRRPDGRVVWLRDSCEQERDAAGHVVRLVGTVQDVTDQKMTEQALRESEARLADAQRRAKIAYWNWTGTGHGLEWSSDVAGLLGVQPDAMPETSDTYIRRFVHDADRDALAALYQRATEDPSPYETEYRIVKADGSVAWIRELGEPVAGDSVQPNYVGTLQDVTEQKQAELALRDSEARMRAILDNAPLMIYLKDIDGRYQLINREFERIDGVTDEQMRGKTIFDILPRDLAEKLTAADREIVEQGRAITQDIHMPDRDHYRDMVAIKFPVRDGMGKIVSIGGFIQDVTERKRAEAEARRTQMLLQSFMDNAPVAVAIKDLDRRFVILNSKVEQAFGRAARDMIGRRSVDLANSEGARAVDRLEQEVIATGRVAASEVFFPERDSLPWTFEVKFPIRDASGAMVAIGGVALDISARKRAELALSDSEARFRSFLDYAPFDIVVKDLDGRYLMINRGVEVAWGLPAAEIIGKTLRDVSRSTGVAQAEAMENEVIETGEAVTQEVRFADLGPEWTYEVKFPIRDAGGRIVALGGVALDVSDRKRAQVALAESEARLRRAQQQARLAYWSWQFTTGRTAEEFRWSPGSGQLLGLTDAEMPRNDAESMSFTHPDDRDRLRRLYVEVRAGLDNYAVEYRIRRRDGGVVWVREVAEVVRDAEGRRVGIEGTMQDITDQRALEEQLRQAQKMESIGQLTGGIAHDFNNLMAVILGNLELLAEDLADNAAARQKIDTAIRSTLRGSDLTHRLLAFARQQSLAPKLTQIAELVRGMRDLLLRPLGPGIEASFDLAGDLWPTEIDQARLETSLLNLVINARDAMPDGGRLTIAASNVMIEPGDVRQSEGLAPGDYVLIAVADTGAGMTEAVRARAFEPFFTTKGVGKGTGLGLSMVYGFVKQSGGHVEIVSEIGRGTTVRIYLPCAKGPGAVATGPVSAGVGAHETILIVENDPAVLATADECLRGLGYDVVAAVDGPSALATLAQRDDVDLLLAGVVLTGHLDGNAVARQAAAMRPHLRIVSMAGTGPDAVPPQGSAERGWRLLARPFRKVDLARAVREALDDRGGE